MPWYNVNKETGRKNPNSQQWNVLIRAKDEVWFANQMGNSKGSNNLTIKFEFSSSIYFLVFLDNIL